MLKSQTPAARHSLKALITPLTAVAFLAPSCGTAHCQAAERVDPAAQRARLQMTSAPKDAVHVLAVLGRLKAQPKGAATPQLSDVTVVGQIGGMPNQWPDTHPDFPWFAGQASFFLVDSKIATQFAKHAKHHGGDHHCAFCQSLAAKNAHAVAVVNLTDEQGKTLKVDARELLDLREGQSVTVRGRAELRGGTMLVIQAEGLHVSEPRQARRAPR